MNQIQSDTFLLSITALDPDAETPLYRQIYESIRLAILDSRLRPGARLPSSRDLADLLGVSRNTVLNAFDQLLAEGYLEAKMGAGTFVTQRLPEGYLQAQHDASVRSVQEKARTLSQRGQSFARHFHASAQGGRAIFAHARPDLEAFPFDIWARLTARCTRGTAPDEFAYGQHPGGFGPLRRAITTYLRTARAVACEPEQILVVAGSQQALYLAGQVLLDPGDSLWMEDPGYVGARNAFLCAAADLIPVPVDEEGMKVEAALKRGARVSYVTPSHQFPLGYTMSLARRMQLLQWAATSDGWIIEDDYDSEYRYSGAPLASLQGLDTNARVVYIGSFSKVLFPGLRLGYLVVPPDLLGAFRVAQGAMSLSPPIISQMTLARFMEEGHFTRHIRRMRTIYAERRDAFVAAVEVEAGDRLELGASDAGLHVTAWLPPGTDERAVQKCAAVRGVSVIPLSWLHLQQSQDLQSARRPGLVLGFAGTPLEAIRPGVQQLARAIDEAIKGETQLHD